MKATIIFLVLFAAAVLITPGLAAQADYDPTKAKALFEQRCSSCHGTSRPLSRTESPDGWRNIVMRMKGHSGGRITDADAETIIKYLIETRGRP